MRGTHGRLPDNPEYGPVLLCSEPALRQQEFAATEVKGLLLDLAGVADTGSSPVDSSP